MIIMALETDMNDKTIIVYKQVHRPRHSVSVSTFSSSDSNCFEKRIYWDASTKRRSASLKLITFQIAVKY